MAYVIAVVLLVLAFALSLCRVSADADRRGEEAWRNRPDVTPPP